MCADVAAPPGAVDAVERKRLDRACEPPNGWRIQGNVVRITIHEAQGTAIRRYHGNIAGQQSASTVRACAPVQDGGSGKMPAGSDEQNVIGEFLAFPRPENDRGVRS